MSEQVTETAGDEENTLPSPQEVMQGIADREAAEAAEGDALVTLTLDEAVQAIDDGSQIDPQAGKSWRDVIDAVKSAAVGVATMVVSLAKVRSDAGRAYGEALASILLPNGVPDWGGKSKAAGIVRQYAIDAAMERIADTTQSQRDNERNAIVKQYERNHRERLIREHVVRTTTQLDNEGNTLLLFPDGPDDTSKMFLAHVREQYRQSGIGTTRAMPEGYRNAEDKEAMRAPASGGPGTGTKGPSEIIGAAVDTVGNAAIRFAAVALLRLTSAIVIRIRDGENLQFQGTDDKAKVGEILDRVAELAKYGSRLTVYRDKVTADESEGMLVYLYDADADDATK